MVVFCTLHTYVHTFLICIKISNVVHSPHILLTNKRTFTTCTWNVNSRYQTHGKRIKGFGLIHTHTYTQTCIDIYVPTYTHAYSNISTPFCQKPTVNSIATNTVYRTTPDTLYWFHFKDPAHIMSDFILFHSAYSTSNPNFHSK